MITRQFQKNLKHITHHTHQFVHTHSSHRMKTMQFNINVNKGIYYLLALYW